MIKLMDLIEERFFKHRDMFEDINDEDLNELASPDFEINKFKTISSYPNKIKYAKEMLGKQIGTGSSRIVFIIDDNKVLKLAKNRKGIIQNETEIRWKDDYYYGSLLANVLDNDEDSLWVIMELAKKPKKSDFKRLWNVDFDELGRYLHNANNINNGKRKMFSDPKSIEVFDNSEDVEHLKSFIFDSDSLVGDVVRLGSWGLVKRDGKEELVLIDFGITNKNYQSYYK